MQTQNPGIGPHLLPVVVFFVCLVSTGLIYQQTVTGLVDVWLVFDGGYGHGLLVAVCSLYLCCRALLNPAISLSSSTWIVLPVLLILSVLATIANVLDVELLPQLIFPIMIWFAFLMIAGTGPARRILVPLALLYFAIPIWDYLNDTLVIMTSRVVGFMVGRSSIPAYITGNSIFLPAGEIVIASGCSGLRYLVIGLFLGSLGSYLNFVSYRREAVLLAGFLFISLLANWLRVYGITMVAFVTEMQHPLIRDHEFAGWVLFMVCMTPLLYVGARGQLPATDDSGPLVMNTAPGGSRSRILSMLTVWLALLAGPVWFGMANEQTGISVQIEELKSSVGADWSVQTYIPGSEDWRPRIIEPDSATRERYIRQNASITVYQYLYGRTAERQEIVPYISDLYGRENWAMTFSTTQNSYRLLGLTNKVSQKQIRMAYRFEVGGMVTSNYLLAKLYQFPALFLHRPYALVTAIVAECDNNCELADRNLADFLEGR